MVLTPQIKETFLEDFDLDLISMESAITPLDNIRRISIKTSSKDGFEYIEDPEVPIDNLKIDQSDGVLEVSFTVDVKAGSKDVALKMLSFYTSYVKIDAPCTNLWENLV